MARGTFEKKSYLSCSQGKWRQRVDKSNPDAKLRIAEGSDGSKREVYELVDDYVEGRIQKIWVDEHDKFGRSWAIQIYDGKETMVLQVNLDSGYSTHMISKLANCDLSKPIMFIPYYFEEEKKTVMVLMQNGSKIQSHFTKEHPNGFPPFPDGGDKDDIKIWKASANKFLIKFVEKNIIPKLPDDDQVALDNLDSGEFPQYPEEEKKKGEKDTGYQDDVPFPDETSDLPFN